MINNELLQFFSHHSSLLLLHSNDGIYCPRIPSDQHQSQVCVLVLTVTSFWPFVVMWRDFTLAWSREEFTNILYNFVVLDFYNVPCHVHCLFKNCTFVSGWERKDMITSISVDRSHEVWLCQLWQPVCVTSAVTPLCIILYSLWVGGNIGLLSMCTRLQESDKWMDSESWERPVTMCDCCERSVVHESDAAKQNTCLYTQREYSIIRAIFNALYDLMLHVKRLTLQTCSSVNHSTCA